MGGSASILTPEQVAELKESSGFSQKELKRLHKRFRKLDRNEDGRINVDEFKAMPELQTNPLLERIVELFDVDEDAYVNFDDFITALSIFSIKGSPVDKLRCTSLSSPLPSSSSLPSSSPSFLPSLHFFFASPSPPSLPLLSTHNSYSLLQSV